MFQLLIASLFVVYCNGGALSGGYGGGLVAGGGGPAGLGGYGLRAGLGGYGLGNGLVLGNGFANGLVFPNGLGNGFLLGNGLNGLGLNGLAGGAIPFGPSAPISFAASGPIAPLAPLGAPIGAPIAVGPVVSQALPVNAAIQSRRTFEVRPVILPQEPVQPSLIEVEPQELPVQIVFRSISSPVLVQQIHTPGAPVQVESTQSEEEPQRVIHEVLRPVIQEVREVIQPFRRVTQEVRPVLEEVHTVVAKGEGRVRPAYPVPAPYPVAPQELLSFEPIGAPVAVGGPALGYDGPGILAGPIGPGPLPYGGPAPVAYGPPVAAGPVPYSKYGPYGKARAAKAAKA